MGNTNTNTNTNTGYEYTKEEIDNLPYKCIEDYFITNLENVYFKNICEVHIKNTYDKRYSKDPFYILPPMEMKYSYCGNLVLHIHSKNITAPCITTSNSSYETNVCITNNNVYKTDTLFGSSVRQSYYFDDGKYHFGALLSCKKIIESNIYQYVQKYVDIKLANIKN
jgi:hypothetical protein